MAEKRKHRIEILMSDEEKNLLEKRFELSTSKSRNDFVRGMILDGVVVRLDEKKISDIYRAVIGIANNVNQIAVRVNSTGNIYTEDIAEIQKGVDTILQQQRYFQSELLKLKR